MMLNLSLDDLKLITKSRGIKDYENLNLNHWLSKDDLIKILSEPKTKISLFQKKIKDT